MHDADEREFMQYSKDELRGSYMKFPTLCELYMHLFHKTPENLHNSMMDVLVCLRCYLKSNFRKILQMLNLRNM
jgi:hypothetical protein